MIRMCIADAHEVYNEALPLMLKKEQDIEVKHTCNNAKKLVNILPLIRVDILLVDIFFPGINPQPLLKHIKLVCPNQKVVLFIHHAQLRYLKKLGNYSYPIIYKDTSYQNLTAVLRQVSAGEPMSVNGDTLIDDILTKREIEIVQLICQGYTNSKIAEQLYLHRSTIETHRRNIMRKIKVTNVAGLVRWTMDNCLID